uniref:Uncharacterized protein n=1 Tax=Rhizophora mucronata TaxID=61149 RepID=A0A2P2QGY8_RHIMU
MHLKSNIWSHRKINVINQSLELSSMTQN